MARKGIVCKRVRTKAHTKTVCRSKRTGKIVKGGGKKLVCPKRWGKLKVHRSKRGSCYVVGTNGQRRFVKKIKRRAKR